MCVADDDEKIHPEIAIDYYSWSPETEFIVFEQMPFVENE